MGRTKSRFRDLPARMIGRERRGRVLYYYCAGGKQIPLGSDRVRALARWAEIECAAPTSGTFRAAAQRYEAEVLPTKSPKTARDQRRQIPLLVAAFGAMPLDDMQPVDIRGYLDHRSAKVSANREIALLSHIFNMAREWGMTAAANPCAGVTRHKERARGVYVTDAMFQAVYEAAAPELRDAMDLALLIGQRVADLLGARRVDLADGHLEIRQRKTGTPLRFELTPALQAVIDRALARPRKAASLWILADRHGHPLTAAGLRNRFDAARAGVAAAGRPDLAAWQFRDLRAKTASDSESLEAAQDRLGHTSAAITRRVYRRGAKVKPLR